MQSVTAELRFGFDNAQDAAIFFEHLANAYKALTGGVKNAAKTIVETVKAAPAPAELPRASGANAGTTALDVVGGTEAPEEPAAAEKAAEPAKTAKRGKAKADKAPEAVAEPEKPASSDFLEGLIGPTETKPVSLDELRVLGNRLLGTKGLGPTVMLDIMKEFGVAKFAEVSEEKRPEMAALINARIANAEKGIV